MNGETERALRRLFSETQHEPADEAFVARVTGRVAGHRRIRAMVFAGAGLASFALAAALSAFLPRIAAPVALAPARLVEPLEPVLAAPTVLMLSVVVGLGILAGSTLWTSD